ncbi:unnamed protein product, partial [Staurois parvus]
PAASPAISSGRCRHLSSGFRSLRRQDVTSRKFKNVKKSHRITLLYQNISHTFCP